MIGEIRMKKLYSLLLVICLIFSLSACGNNDTTKNINNSGFCVECGGEISSTDKFCSSCGVAVNKQINTASTDNQAEIKENATSSTATGNSSTATSLEPSNPSTTTEPNETTGGSAHIHSYSGATCTESAKCSCGATEGSALGHKWKEATCQAPKTCTVCNETEGNTVDHSLDSSGQCKWCQQILTVSPANLKNREYEIWPLATDSTETFYSLSIDFDSRKISYDMYLSCEAMHDPQPNVRCGSVYYKNKGYHLEGTSGSLTFTNQISDNYIVISNIKYHMDVIITLEVLSNDTLRVVSVSGRLPMKLSIGDILK